MSDWAPSTFLYSTIRLVDHLFCLKKVSSDSINSIGLGASRIFIASFISCSLKDVRDSSGLCLSTFPLPRRTC